MLGVGESRIDRGLVAERDRDPDIAARTLLPDFRRRGLRRLLEIDQRRQQFVVHRNELGGVARLRLGFGNDEGDAVADAADAVGEQHRARGRKTGRPAPGIGMKNGGMPPTLSVSASAPVRTHSTPGAALAALTSTRLMIACACGESTATP